MCHACQKTILHHDTVDCLTKWTFTDPQLGNILPSVMDHGDSLSPLSPDRDSYIFVDCI